MTKNEGSFWRDMRYIGVPGVDNLSQIGPGIVADFPKLAGVRGPSVWPSPGLDRRGRRAGPEREVRLRLPTRARHQLHEYPRPQRRASRRWRGLADPAAAIGQYISRAQHLMAIGRPAAQVALFHPTDSYWMGDQEADTVTVKLTTQLMEHQIDFDHIDADTLATVCTLDGGGLKNLSGQIYRAVIVPTSTVIQKSVLERLRAFAAAGGKVVFVGRTPTMVVGQDFPASRGRRAGPELCHPRADAGNHRPRRRGAAAAGRQTRRRLPADQIHAPLAEGR